MLQQLLQIVFAFPPGYVTVSHPPAGGNLIELSALVFWLLCVLALAQAGVAVPLFRALGRTPASRSGFTPKAAVILCLRGHDPYLRQTLESVLGMDYPDFEFHVVVDSEDDSAWPAIRRAQELDGSGIMRVQVLSQRHGSCGLKCSSLLQALSGLSSDIEVSAHLDADSVPHARWLRELVQPLSDPRVGAAYGNRWFEPVMPNLGSMVRCLWNACAVPSMNFHRIPWGGSLALRTSHFRESEELSEHWSRAFCEDTLLADFFARRGLEVRFVPLVLMVNRERCSVMGFARWVRRQLLTVRLYHRAWPIVLVHAVLTTVSLLAGFALRVHAGLAVYAGVMLVLGLVLDRAVQGTLVRQGEVPYRWTVQRALLALLSIPVTQLIYCWAAVSAHFLKRELWRGVTYRIGGSWDIEIVEDCPQNSDPDEGVSL